MTMSRAPRNSNPSTDLSGMVLIPRSRNQGRKIRGVKMTKAGDPKKK
ncbi:BnaC03g34030D [Brassica napus]|uniref:(rape) hypothetical protein n=1 Tax=Brassica napus TaxID=3708 RepID=A0A078HS69_BRANA|nr:unnamed protein product [Brassica napus]CAF1703407.1 unnamed protein product [Brassica napus]CDY40687.1 BnaC03g34030D [Brassica napus]